VVQINKMTVELIVSDVRKTTDYYSSILEFVLLDKVEVGEKYSWALMGNGESTKIMFISKESVSEEVKDFKTKVSGDDLILLIEIEKIEKFYECIKDKITLVKEFQQTTYGSKEFGIRDVNGIVLIFSERDE
jgi:uncharacterized glyoxalase superfamily protein PhnB